jgi:hypothetical protein
MARDPDDRYDSSADLRAALLAAGAVPSPAPDLTSTTVGAAPGHTTAAPRPQLPAAAGAGTSAAPTFRQTERSWLLPTALVVVVAVALGIAGLLLGRSGAGNLFDGVRDAIGGGSTTPTALEIAEATAFDPEGDGHENDDRADAIRDGDPTTSWRTEGYNDRDITRLKSGVGIVLSLGTAREIDRLEMDSPTNDWRVAVYVADAPAADLAGWGEPVATSAGIPAGTSTIDLDGARGSAVLIWILDRGDASGRAAAEIQEARLLGS